jgi:hypothetical protein
LHLKVPRFESVVTTPPKSMQHCNSMPIINLDNHLDSNLDKIHRRPWT